MHLLGRCHHSHQNVFMQLRRVVCVSLGTQERNGAALPSDSHFIGVGQEAAEQPGHICDVRLGRELLHEAGRRVAVLLHS